jgi:hypothetical protein
LKRLLEKAADLNAHGGEYGDSLRKALVNGNIEAAKMVFQSREFRDGLRGATARGAR